MSEWTVTQGVNLRVWLAGQVIGECLRLTVPREGWDPPSACGKAIEVADTLIEMLEAREEADDE